MECIKTDTVIYVSSTKDFKTARKIMHGKKYLLHWELDIVSAQKRYNTINRIEHEYMCCHADFAVNGNF